MLTSSELAPYREKLQIVFQDPHSSANPAFTIFGTLEDPLKLHPCTQALLSAIPVTGLHVICSMRRLQVQAGITHDHSC